MNWKFLLTTSIMFLVIFFAYQQCSKDDKPDFDKIQAKERATRTSAHDQKIVQQQQKDKKEAIDAAEKEREERPDARTHLLETEQFKAVLTTKGAALASIAMKNPQYKEAPRDWASGLRIEDSKEFVPVDLVTTYVDERELWSPLRFEIYESDGLEGLLPNADYEIWEKDADHVVFRYTQPGLPVEIYKKFEITDNSSPFLLWLTIRIVNTGQEKVSFRSGVSQYGYQHEEEAGGSMFTRQPNLLQGICRYGDETESIPWNDDDLEHPFVGTGKILFTGVQTNFFVNAIIPGDETPATCMLSRTLSRTAQQGQTWGVVTSSLRFAETELAPGESKTFKVKNYMGPKRYQLLQKVGNGLHEAVDFGIFWPICQILLKLLFFFQSFVLNWGVAIILLTVVVKVVLMPLTHKSFQSSSRMKALKPEIDKLNKKFKDDPQAKQQATMALYKQHKINPLGGCLPMLLQMPIWFALFSTLRASPELYRAPFFGWITDLSSPDPYFVTPILMGAAMFVQNAFTPAMGDALQAKMMKYFMPIMFTGMMLFLPSGLTLYIFVNTVLSIAQQIYIQKRSSKPKGA